MTRMPKILLSFCLALLYCFALCVYGLGMVSTNKTLGNAEGNTSTLSSASIFSNELHTIVNTNNSVSGYHNFPTTQCKDRLQSASVWVKIVAIRVAHSTLSYTFFSNNIISRFERTDIIFPFHYFW